MRPRTWLAILLCSVTTTAFAEPSADEQALMTERDTFILQIFRGKDVAANVSGFKKLLDRHQQGVATAEQTKRSREARSAALEVYKKTSLDYEGGWLCRLSEDAPPNDHRVTDWGRVVRKSQASIDSQGAVLLDGSAITIYEVEGKKGRRFVTPKEDTKHGAAVGDLVVLCSFVEKTRSDLLPPWNNVQLTIAKHFGTIAEPPRIVAKSQWNPIHITDHELRDAIMYKRWSIPAGRHVVALVRVDKEISEGRLAMVSRYWADPFVLEVPPSLPRRALLQPGEYVWVIMGSPRFDKELEKLVLVAADVELRYLVER